MAWESGGTPRECLQHSTIYLHGMVLKGSCNGGIKYNCVAGVISVSSCGVVLLLVFDVVILQHAHSYTNEHIKRWVFEVKRSKKEHANIK